jgi:hypothetical protein
MFDQQLFILNAHQPFYCRVGALLLPQSEGLLYQSDLFRIAWKSTTMCFQITKSQYSALVASAATETVGDTATRAIGQFSQLFFHDSTITAVGASATNRAYRQRRFVDRLAATALDQHH